MINYQTTKLDLFPYGCVRTLILRNVCSQLIYIMIIRNWSNKYPVIRRMSRY